MAYLFIGLMQVIVIGLVYYMTPQGISFSAMGIKFALTITQLILEKRLISLNMINLYTSEYYNLDGIGNY